MNNAVTALCICSLYNSSLRQKTVEIADGFMYKKTGMISEVRAIPSVIYRADINYAKDKKS